MMPLVGIVMGSERDRPVMEEAAGLLRTFEVAFEMQVLSAHRQPAKTREYARRAGCRSLRRAAFSRMLSEK